VKEKTSGRLRSDEKYQAASEEKSNLQRRLSALEHPYVSGGFVWVYLRKPERARTAK
jgi:hypothetical protein